VSSELAVADFRSEVELLDLRRVVQRAVRGLPQMECRVVDLRFGLSGPGFTLREIGRQLQLSTERIRQIEARALRRLHQAAQRNGIADYRGALGEG